MKRKNEFYSVHPRYGPGSPGQVSEEIALSVASHEKEMYEAHIEGLYGEDAKLSASIMGLTGVAEYMVERQGGWDVLDLITGERKRRESIPAKKVQKGDVLCWRNERAFIQKKILDVLHQGALVHFQTGVLGEDRYTFTRNYTCSIERPLGGESGK